MHGVNEDERKSLSIITIDLCVAIGELLHK